MKFSDVMNRLVSTIPLRGLKAGVIFFCVLSGGFSIYLAMSPIFFSQHAVIDTGRIRIPAHQGSSDSNRRVDTISEKIYRDIQNYRSHMDSTGQLIRTGLLDTMKVIEDIYHSQKSTSYEK